MDLKQTEIGLLIALDALLEAEGVTPAAKKLGISQPAMSAQLARLRTMFKDPLLIQSGRRLIPTTRALALKQPLQRLLGDLDALVRECVPFDPLAPGATFRLIGTDYVHVVITPSLMTAIAGKAPGVRLALLPFAASGVWQSLESSQADAALITGMELPEARKRDGPEEDFIAVQRRGHPRGRGRLTLDAFCDASHILVSPEGGGFVGVVDRMLETLGRRRRIVYSLPSFLLAPPIVAASDLICVLPRRLAALHQDKVAGFELPFASPRFSLQLVWHPRRQNDPAHIWFRGEIMSVLKRLGARPDD
jgi:DNA-binding transcriptional LysR family regulator